MKQNMPNTQDKALSLNKTTIARLPKAQLGAIKGGDGKTIQNNMDIPESCGYACGDCMSTVTRLTISF